MEICREAGNRLPRRIGGRNRIGPRRQTKVGNDLVDVGRSELAGTTRRTQPPGSRDDASRAQLVQLFETEFDAVFQFVLARSGDRAVADDVAADTFFSAAKALASGAEEHIGRPWLFVVARRRLIDHWRKAERERNRLRRVLELDPDYDDTGTADEQSTDGRSEAVIAALRSLPERQRAAIALRYLDEYSVTEIAETMEIEYRAAESLLARGRRNFISAWEQQ